jgi:uncharacterized DUF497 family protein
VEPPVALPDPVAFDWDDGNAEKNRARHGVVRSECEELFSVRPLLLVADEAHSDREPRSYALGRTRTGRRLFVAFTVRGDSVRVISARDMSRRERRIDDAASED